MAFVKDISHNIKPYYISIYGGWKIRRGIPQGAGVITHWATYGYRGKGLILRADKERKDLD